MRLLYLVAWAASAAAVDPPRAFVTPTDSLLNGRDALDLPYVSRFTNVIFRRQSSSPSLNLGSGNNASDPSQWNKETGEACVKALSSLQRSTNPSGNCVCYNMPSLDTTSGSFSSEIRVYRVSEPRDGFAGVAPSNINVGVQYNGASVSPVSAAEFSSMAASGNPGAVSTSTLKTRDEHREPQLLQTYMFFGQIDPTRMTSNLTMAQLEAIVMPTFTLTAQNTAGGSVSTNLSLNEASFLNGVFSKQVVRGEFAAAQAAVDAKVAEVRNGTVAFVLPGIQIMIFPIGTVITGIWLVLGVAAYGFGTYERVMYASTYKRQQQTASKMTRGANTF